MIKFMQQLPTFIFSVLITVFEILFCDWIDSLLNKNPNYFKLTFTYKIKVLMAYTEPYGLFCLFSFVLKIAFRSISTRSTIGFIGSLFINVSKYFIISNIKFIVGRFDGVPFIPCSKSFSRIFGQFETFLGRVDPYLYIKQ